MVQLTDSAINKVKDFGNQNNAYQGKNFRIYVQDGGCQGFSYGFTFDQYREGDEINKVGEIEVLIDPHSAKYLNGAKIDYVEDMKGTGFVIENPNATGSCGCGHSDNF